MNATDLPKQEDFYKHYLRGYDGKQRVIVLFPMLFDMSVQRNFSADWNWMRSVHRRWSVC